MDKLSILDVIKPEWLLKESKKCLVPWYKEYFDTICDNVTHCVREVKLWFRDTKIGIKNIIKYLPIIWKDRDWDYCFVLYLLKFKLKNMRNHIVSNNIIEESKKVGKEIDNTIYHIDSYLNSDDVFEMISQDLLLEIKNTKDSNESLKKEKEYYISMHEFEQKNWNNIWTGISENMQGWWD